MKKKPMVFCPGPGAISAARRQHFIDAKTIARMQKELEYYKRLDIQQRNRISQLFSEVTHLKTQIPLFLSIEILEEIKSLINKR